MIEAATEHRPFRAEAREHMPQSCQETKDVVWKRPGGLTSNLDLQGQVCADSCHLNSKEQYPAALTWLGPSRDQPGCMGCTWYDTVAEQTPRAG